MAEDKKPQAAATVPEQTPEMKLLEKVISMPEDQVLPWEAVTLPSEGLYYDGAVPGGRVEVRPMGLFADKILATQRLAQSGKSLDWLFKKCVRFPDGKFDPLNLLAGDRIFLLYYLRGITHGNDYEFVVKCTNEECGIANTSNYDLNELYKTVVKPSATLGIEPFKVSLPYLSNMTKADFWVKVRLLRGYDMQNMLTTRKTAKRIQNVGRNQQPRPMGGESIDETLEDNLNMLIVEAMGSTDKRQIRELVSRMHASDTAAIREFLRDNSPGIDTSIMVTCSTCGNEMRMELPITEQFFRPTPGRRS